MWVKQTFRVLGDKFDKLLLVGAGTSGGLFLAQFPQYLAQYLQRLGGHIDEAKLAAKLFKIPELTERAELLAKGLKAIVEAPPFFQLPQFLTHAQWEIAREAWKHYTPGMTYNQESLYYVAAGCLAGIVIYGILKGLILFTFSVFRGKPVPKNQTNMYQT